MLQEEWRDQDKFEKFIRDDLEKLGLPTTSEFILKLSEAYFSASKKLVYFRRDRAIANQKESNAKN